MRNIFVETDSKNNLSQKAHFETPLAWISLKKGGNGMRAQPVIQLLEINNQQRISNGSELLYCSLLFEKWLPGCDID